MEFMRLLQERYSVRSFLDRDVEEEKIQLILEAGRIAPSARNLQPCVVFVLKEKEIAQLTDVTKYTFGTKVMLVVCYDKRISYKRSVDQYEMGPVDASIAATQMMLMTASLGLGTTWVGNFRPDKLCTLLNLEESIVPVCLFPLGYPSEESEPSPAHFDRKDMSLFCK